jgi:hypothetical protein
VPAVEVTPMATNRLSPEVLEPVRRQLGVAHGVLDVFVAEPRLQCPGVVAGISKRVAATVPQHGGSGGQHSQGALLGGVPGGALHVTFCLAVGAQTSPRRPVPERSSPGSTTLAWSHPA